MEKLTNKEIEELLSILKVRFEKNMDRHPDMQWNDVLYKLIDNNDKMWSLMQMERTGGEPDLVVGNQEELKYAFYDCSKETPLLRRNLCYDKKALESRKNFKPDNNVMDMANEMGINVLNEEDYKFLQSFGEFDLKTSSWLETDDKTRKLGGAIFGDRRFERVFIYHNGAESYYSSRGFRGYLII